MKKQLYSLLLLSFALLPGWMSAQFQPIGNDLYHLNGEVGIGLTAPGRPLHILDEQTGPPAIFAPVESFSVGTRLQLKYRPNINTPYTHYRWDQMVTSRGFSIYDRRLEEYRLYIDNDGHVGLGLTNPDYRLEVDGKAKVSENLAVGGDPTNNELEVYGTGRVSDFLRVGDLNITPNARMVIDNSTSFCPEFGLYVYGNNPSAGTQTSIYTVSEDASVFNQGLFSRATGECLGSGEGSFAVGVQAEASNADYNYGLFGQAHSSSTCKYGGSYAVYGRATGASQADWAGFFTGRTFCTDGVWASSDQKLKREIRELGPITERLMQLNPRSYEYKTDEFKALNLPEGAQMGFLAQELGTVFPEMTRETVAPPVFDDEGNIEIPAVEFTAVNYQSLIPVLVKGFQEQQLLLEEQQREILQLREALSSQSDNKWQGENLSGMERAAVLGQNVPNPFDNLTSIPFYLPENVTNAEILIFDLNGTQLRVEELKERGEAELKMDFSNLPAGMYLYTLLADGQEIATRRMILRK